MNYVTAKSFVDLVGDHVSFLMYVHEVFLAHFFLLIINIEIRSSDEFFSIMPASLAFAFRMRVIVVVVLSNGND